MTFELFADELFAFSTDGAAVFYTAQTLPASFAKLRQYILHRLFSSPTTLVASSLAPPAPSPAQPTSPSAAAATAAPPISTPAAPRTSSTLRFPFPHRANVIDRDAVVVPAGWDTWGKIRILRERFDCEAVGRGWEADMERRAGRAEVRGEADKGGLEREFGMVVVDFEAEDPVRSTLLSLLAAL